MSYSERELKKIERQSAIFEKRVADVGNLCYNI